MIERHEKVKQRGAEFWNANPCGGYWGSYSEFQEWIQRTEPYIFQILDRYDWNGRKVVEIGCGQGTTLNYLPRYGATMYGLDMSLQSIQQARAGATELGHLSRVRFARADAERLPFTDAAFDMALSIGVLHHTPDTAVGVNEIYRLLKPGGSAIVMLYRSGNPKWWSTRLLRGLSALADRANGRSFVIADRLRARYQSGSAGGTALLELFGVPVLNAFSNTQARAMFAAFSEVSITNHQPGFRRMADIVPFLRAGENALGWIDRTVQQTWGFYQVIEARK